MASMKKHGNEDPRGSKPKGKGLTARLQYGNTGEGVERADWGTVSPQALQDLIGVVTGTGAAILLGYSRDRGAYRILIMDDDGKMPVWIPCTTDVDQAVEDLVNEVWRAAREGDGTP